MTLHLICEDLFLRLIAVLEKLLDNIVPKYVRHQLQGIWKDLAKDLFFLVAVGAL